MRILFATVLTLGLVGCSSTTPAEPDAEPTVDPVAALIVERYGDCMPGLAVEDVQRVSDRRYSVVKGDYSVAWTIGGKNAETGEPFTVPDEDSMATMERLGCA
jgi:CubicO group peptidase (beta-lactamase class C family)